MDQCIKDGVGTLQCIPCLVENVVNFGLIISGIAAAGFIIVSGIKLMLSGGDSLRVAQARKTMTFAIIGLVLVVLSYTIINFAGKSFGITIFTQCG